MSAPLTAGMLVLLREDFMKNKFYSNVSAALLKAALINGAQELGYGFPSNTTGWGRTNLSNSLMPSQQAYMLHLENLSGLSTAEYYVYNFTIINTTPAIKVTLVWTDYKGTSNAAISLVNDLNLEIISPNGTKFIGNSFIAPFNASADSRNTVEQVVIFTNNSQLGSYQINVSGYNIPQSPQPFAIVISAGINATPSAAKFDGITTNFNQIPLLYNTSNIILENTSNGKIIWSSNAVTADQDFDNNINISRNLITINTTHLHSTLNSNVTISLYSTGFASPVPIKNNAVCADCNIILAAAENLTFTASSLGNFSALENASLVIWDSTHSSVPYSHGATYETQLVQYFANYTNTTSNAIITSANCSIQFSNAVGFMFYNETKALFEYNRTFSSAAAYNYNITCNQTYFINATAANSTIIINSTNVQPYMPGNFSIRQLANNSINISWDFAKDASSYNIWPHPQYLQ